MKSEKVKQAHSVYIDVHFVNVCHISPYKACDLYCANILQIHFIAVLFNLFFIGILVVSFNTMKYY